MKVELLDHMGSDLDVVNAARVSFDKESEWDHKELSGGRFMGGQYVWGLHERDARLISYLAYHNHWSPFSHQFIKFRVKAPMFVARQLAKHQVGFAWNEVSRRYVDSDPEFFEPKTWRKRAENVKQGSSDEGVNTELIEYMEDEGGCIYFPSEIYERSISTYRALLKLGVCPEQARMVLPQSTYTEWIWTGSLYAWSRMFNLRVDHHTQQETREVAVAIGRLIEPLFPVSWKVLTDEPE